MQHFPTATASMSGGPSARHTWISGLVLLRMFRTQGLQVVKGRDFQHFVVTDSPQPHRFKKIQCFAERLNDTLL